MKTVGGYKHAVVNTKQGSKTNLIRTCTGSSSEGIWNSIDWNGKQKEDFIRLRCKGAYPCDTFCWHFIAATNKLRVAVSLSTCTWNKVSAATLEKRRLTLNWCDDVSQDTAGNLPQLELMSGSNPFHVQYFIWHFIIAAIFETISASRVSVRSTCKWFATGLLV